jgi:hypothetical protein
VNRGGGAGAGAVSFKATTSRPVSIVRTSNPSAKPFRSPITAISNPPAWCTTVGSCAPAEEAEPITIAAAER